MAKNPQGEALAQDARIMRQLGHQLEELQSMGLAELRSKYLELFGEEAHSKNLPYLRKKLAFRLQERMRGGLPPAVRERLESLMPKDVPCKVKAHRARRTAHIQRGNPDAASRDSRLPSVGTVLRREHQGLAHEVEILDSGFRYRGRLYGSLSAVARAITGTAWNGFGFFGLLKGTRHE